MARKKWFLVLSVFVIVVQQIQAGCICRHSGKVQSSCVCNEKGKDACSCAGAIRPRPNHPKRPEFELPPVGDTCWCSKTMVQPASLPKPCPKGKKHTPTCGCQGAYHAATYGVPQANCHKQTYVRDYSPPADPISISLAVQAGKAIQVPEAKLAYGFVRKPLNGLPKIYVSSVKEENLYALANDVITLKKPLAPKTIKKEEDYPEPEEEEPEEEGYEPPSLTYKQLGYKPDDFQNPTFIPMPPIGGLIKEAAASLLEGAGGGNCGFKPGSITKIKHHKKFGPINCLWKHV